MKPPTFPVRPSREAFGPRFRNEFDPISDEEDLDAATFDALCFQVAGMGGAVPLAWALVSGAGALLAAWEAWDPNGGYAPEVARTTTGVYVVTYDATAPDADEIEIDLAFLAAEAKPQGTVNVRHGAAAIAASGHVVDVRTYLANGTTLSDEAFLLQVW